MPSKGFSSPNGLSRFFIIVLCVIWALLVSWVNISLTSLQTNRDQNLPFGFFSLPNGTIFTQDFSYNLVFLKGVEERLVNRPYRLEGQEALMRRMVPEGKEGITHAYSPVTLVLALPLLSLSGRNAYLLYTILCAVGALLLFYFYLLPLAKSRLQVYALLACTISVCVIAGLTVGQSALLTTTFLGAFWYLLKRRPATPSMIDDLLIAALFWALCIKPSVALVPLALLFGARAWRPLALGLLLLLATWICVAGYYGGWWTGFWDYLFLLNHYNNADFTPFFQRGFETADEKHATRLLFSLDRALVLASFLALLILRWTRRITASEQFQGTIWAFLLVSPYLMPSENWIMCLLVVEGAFFQSQHWTAIAGKLLLLIAILNLRSGVTSPWAVEGYLKWLLFAWIVVEWLQARKKLEPENETDLQLSPSRAN